MIRLYVDDLRAAPCGWQLARTVTEAIRILYCYAVEEISLDHDITHAILPGDDNGGNLYQGVCCPETYRAVAYAIALMPEKDRPKKVTLHTWNPAGAAEMYSILEPMVEEVVIKRAEATA